MPAFRAVFRSLAWGVLLALPPAASAEEPASEEAVRRVCGACHVSPDPALFAKRHWKLEVDQGFGFLQKSNLKLDPPSRASVLQYFLDHAPDQVPAASPPADASPCPCQFEQTGYRPAGAIVSGAVSNVQFVHYSDERRLDVLACDMRSNQIFLLQPYAERPRMKVLVGDVPNPCHASVLDFDGDGNRDLLVACLGNLYPTDKACGSVLWLQGTADGKFIPHTLASGIGRVADVRAADFNGDGRLDLVVAEFGWNQIGSVFLLENETSDWSHPQFAKRTLDERHGAIHVPIVDLNNDGHPDFVALISQEHEAVVAFLNDGSGGFERATLFEAGQPAFGSSGIEMVDLDGDGDLDVLYTNGDALDRGDLRPWHSVSWLENRGEYPFSRHEIAKMYGVTRAVAADLDGDGDQDILATSFLPVQAFGPKRQQLNLDAVLLLEQTGRGEFARHTLQSQTCDHASCDVGDFDGDGRIDLVIGNFLSEEPDSIDGPGAWLTIWKSIAPLAQGAK